MPALTDRKWLERALGLAARSPESTVYAVGCVIVGPDGGLIASGFTGETSYPPGELPLSSPHAEEVALGRIRPDAAITASTLYCTMEPCSERKSGRESCAERIIRSGIKRVVFGAQEPFNPEIGIHCCGAEKLRGAGISVTQVEELSPACLKAALRDDR